RPPSRAEKESLGGPGTLWVPLQTTRLAGDLVTRVNKKTQQAAHPHRCRRPEALLQAGENMTAALVDALFEATFRANPAYDLLAFDRLPQHQQTMLAELRADPSMYGVVFRHDSASRACKAVDRDT